MNHLGVTLVLAAALAVGGLSAGEAEAKGRRDGAHAQRHHGAQHHRAAPRKHVMGHHSARHWAKHRGRAHQRAHAAKRFAHRDWHHRRHWRSKHAPRPQRFHRRHRHLRHIHVVPDYAPAYQRALEIETNEFRFSVNASG